MRGSFSPVSMNMYERSTALTNFGLKFCNAIDWNPPATCPKSVVLKSSVRGSAQKCQRDLARPQLPVMIDVLPDKNRTRLTNGLMGNAIIL